MAGSAHGNLGERGFPAYGSPPQFISDLKALRARRSLKWMQGAPDPDRIRLTIAEMDIEPPAFLVPVLEEALRAGETGYADTAEQERACRRFLGLHHGASPASVRCTTDVLAGIRVLLRESFPQGSAVIVETPVYGDLFPTIIEAGCTPKPVPLRRDPASNRYLHDWDALHEAAGADGTRGMLLCQPHNPIGRIWDEREVAATLALARSHDLLLVSNEVHLPLGRGGPVRSVFADPAAHEARLLGLTSASKAFNIPGLKSASIYASEPAATFLNAIPQGLLGRPGILGALATITCYDRGQNWLSALRLKLAECVRTVLTQISLLPVPVTAVSPEATYLVWAEVAPAHLTRFQAALDRSRVAFCVGSDYGGTDFGACFRINAASHPDILTEAFQAISTALDSGMG
jgi:cystathionine beta-lyase